MGQYYRPSILKTNYKLAKNPVETTLCSWDFRNGLKLMEHSWVGNNLVGAFIHLIGENSPYYGKPCVWAGDYADSFTSRKVQVGNDNIYEFARLVDKKLCGEYDCDNHNHLNAKYHKIFGKDIFYPSTFKNWSGHDIAYSECMDSLDSYKYIVNLRTKEYIEIPENNGKDWIVHPLPLLLAESNGRGGGDYHGINKNMCGRWAYHPIGATNTIPTGYKQLVVEFKEG